MLDERGTRVAGADAPAGGGTVRRSFPLLFLDPLLVASDPPLDLPVHEWAVNVAVESDAALATAIGIANRALAVAAFAAAALTLGLVLSVRAARASAELSAMRSDFVSTVTHELKTPIATIRAIGDTIVSGRATGPVLLECAHLVVQESKRLTRLVDNLLAYSRITDITEAYLFEPTEVSELLGAVVQGFAWQLRTCASPCRSIFRQNSRRYAAIERRSASRSTISSRMRFATRQRFDPCGWQPPSLITVLTWRSPIVALASLPTSYP